MSIRRRLLAGLVLGSIFMLVAFGTAWGSLRSDSREVVIGAQNATVRVTFDGYATLDLGPLLPRIRIPQSSRLPLGMDIDVGESVSDATSIEALIEQNAVIASQPDGEIALARSTVRSMLIDAGLRGLGAGALAVIIVLAGWRLVGAQRRAQLRAIVLTAARERPPRPLLKAAVAAVVTALAVAAMVIPYGSQAVPENQWVPAAELLPGAGLTGQLGSIEVAEGAATTTGLALVEGAVTTYNRSVAFYGDLLEAIPRRAFREPREDETVALLVSDRHDNIGMDPVARAIGDAAGATVLITAGDDTSTGGSWEDFSVNSLADAFEGYDVVATAGNHDTGTAVVEAYRRADFTVLDGEPVEVAGIRFLGDNDPRGSGLTANYTEGQESVSEQGQRLAEVACADGDVSTLVVHSPSSGEATAATGCVDLVVSGHLHRQVGPDTVTAPDGRETTVYTNGTTGGAAFAFALGSKLRRDAQVTLLTYRDGRPVGLQPVTITTGGEVVAAEYVELPRPR
jgi:predicted phosphodiesterase